MWQNMRLFSILLGLAIWVCQCNEVRELLAAYKTSYNAPKLWHTYLKFFLNNQLKMKLELVSSLSTIFKCSLVFRQKSVQTYKIPEEYVYLIADDIRRGKSRGRKVINQSEPTGWVNQSVSRYTWLLNKLEWKIILSTNHVAVEMFLNFLSVPTNAVLKCFYASVNVYNCLEEDIGKAWVFCGMISASYLYPPHQKICLQPVLPPRILSSFEIRYTLCDTAIKSQNLEVKNKDYGHFKIVGTFNFENIGQLFVFFMRTDRMSVFLFDVANLYWEVQVQMQVYDGPGLLSPKLPPTADGTVKSSTFQCTLITFTQHRLPNLRFEIRDGEVHQNITLEPVAMTEISLPAVIEGCSMWICNTMVESPEKYNVNITIKHMEFSGNDFFTCTEGGIYILSGEGFAESTCMSHNPRQLFKDSFISFGYVVFLSSISYPHYSTLHAQLQLETTACDQVRLDPCSHYAYCKASHASLKNRCNRLVHSDVCLFKCEKGISLHTDMNILRIWTEREGHLSVVIPINDKKCTLVRLKRVQNHIFKRNYYGDERQCHLELFPNKVNLPHTTLQVTTRYFLKYNSQIDEKLSILTFSNKLDHLIARQDTSDSYTTDRWTSNKTEEVVIDVDNSRNKTGLLVSECFSSDHSLYKTKVSFKSWHSWSFSWVEIMFQVKNHTTEPKAIFEKEDIMYHILPWPTEFEKRKRPAGWYRRVMPLFDIFGFGVNLLPGQLIQDSHAYPLIQNDHTMFYQQSKKTEFCYAEQSIVLTFRTFGKTEINITNIQDFMVWNTTYSVGSLTIGEEIAIPSTNLQASCRENMGQDCCQNLQVAIKFGTYKNYDIIIHSSTPQNCRETQHTFDFCKVFSNLSFYTYSIIKMNRKTKVSWHQSYQLCEQQDAHLPSFFKQSEFEEFLALVKLRPDILVIPTIPVGLIFNPGSKVS